MSAPSPHTAPTRAAAPTQPSWVHWLFVLVIAVVPTLGRFRNGLVSDDLGVIVESPIIHHASNLPRLFAHRALFVSTSDADTPRRPPVDTYRPLTLATFFWDAAISGTRPTSYHATNLALHALCALALFALLSRTVAPDKPLLAALGAAFFAAAPHGHEAHVWINGRSDPCATLALLAALLARTGPRASRPVGAALVGLGYFAALLCKESVGLVAPLLVWVPLEGDERARRVRPHLVAVGAAALAYLALRVFAVEHGGVNPQPGFLRTVVSGAGWYYGTSLRESLAPAEVCLRLLRDERMRAGPAAHVFGWAAAVATVAVALASYKRARWATWGLALFVLALAPSAVIPALRWIGFGRYLYLPAAGLAFALCAGLRAVPEGRGSRFAMAGFGLYVGLFALRLALAVGQWHDNEALSEEAVSEKPDGAIGYSYLAVVREGQHRYDEVIRLYLRADELAPWDSSNLVRAGQWMLARGAPEQSLATAVTGIRRRDAHLPEFHLLAARAFAQMGARPDLAQAHLRACGALAFGGGSCDPAQPSPRRAAP